MERKRLVMIAAALLVQGAFILSLLYSIPSPPAYCPCMEEWLRLGSKAAVCGQPAATGGPSNPLPFSKKPVVMGMATDYKWPDLRNFVVSLRYTNYTGDIVLFVSSDAKSDDVLMWRLRHFNVTVVAVSPTFPYFEKDSLPRMMIECLGPPPMPNLHAVNQRFHVMELWLTAYRSRYDFVFISDTRDVIFQRDPFDWHDRKIEDKLYVTLDTMAINRHGISATWVQMAFGREEYAKIKSETVSCSGTTYGSTDQMLRYLQRMNSWIRKVIEAHKHRLRKDEAVDRDIADLAIHNYIIYQLDWDNRLEFLEHANSPALTMGSFSEFKSQIPPLQVLNDDRQVVNVIHQYDRYQDITKIFDTRYAFLERQSILFNVSLISINVHQ